MVGQSFASVNCVTGEEVGGGGEEGGQVVVSP